MLLCPRIFFPWKIDNYWKIYSQQFVSGQRQSTCHRSNFLSCCVPVVEEVLNGAVWPGLRNLLLSSWEGGRSKIIPIPLRTIKRGWNKRNTSERPAEHEVLHSFWDRFVWFFSCSRLKKKTTVVFIGFSKVLGGPWEGCTLCSPFFCCLKTLLQNCSAAKIWAMISFFHSFGSLAWRGQQKQVSWFQNCCMNFWKQKSWLAVAWAWAKVCELLITWVVKLHLFSKDQTIECWFLIQNPLNVILNKPSEKRSLHDGST